MNKQQLQGAISKLHASDGLVQEVLSMNTKKKNVTAQGKLAKTALIAAIVTVLLVTTAFAAPAIYQALTNGRVGGEEIWLTPTGPEGSHQVQRHDIYVDVQMNEDAPASIETFYLPTMEGGYEQYFGFVYKDQMSAVYRWTNGRENWEDEVCFWQIAGGTYDPKEVYCTVETELGTTPEAKLVQLGGIQGYLVEDISHYGTRHFLWSDGEYLFYLEVPDEYSDEDIVKVLQSIVSVEDILPYCVSMTWEDMETVFE